MNRLQSILNFALLILLMTYCTREFHNPYDRDCPEELWTPSSLTGSVTDGGVLLSWEQSATHFDGFFIDRSPDSVQWNQITPVIIDKTLRSYVDSAVYYGETLFYRVYAQAGLNTSGYSHTSKVIIPTHIAEVVTHEVSDVGYTDAVFNGEIITDGGATVTERGFVYCTDSLPDLADTRIPSGDGIGIFSAAVDGLVPGVTYYVRAYGENSLGLAYGQVQQFTGLDEDEGDVINPNTGRTWLDRNLGASRVAMSSTDEQAYGDLYQWGRGIDGHQKRTSGTTSTLSSNDTPGHGDFILSPDAPYDWRSPKNDNLWQGAAGINNPCPDGYRLPTEAELDAERLSWSSNDAAGAFASPLKLPVAGWRSNRGLFNYVGSDGRYWSCTVDGIHSRNLFLSNGAHMYRSSRAFGYSVRCIKD